MNLDELDAFYASYYDDPVHAAYMCALLERTFLGWTVWREDRVWHARFETWPEGRSISDPNAGTLTLMMRLGGELP